MVCVLMNKENKQNFVLFIVVVSVRLEFVTL